MFVAQYRDEPIFHEHMDILRTLGVATFEGRVYDAAQLTPLGEEVAHLMRSFDSRLFGGRLPEGPSLTDVSPPKVKELIIDEAEIGRADLAWMRQARRYEAYRCGEISSRPAAEVFAQARARLRR